SPIFWQVMPLAPASICNFASIGLLWVLMCGRLATPAASHAFCTRAMLRSTRSMSMTATGVPYSRAILAARGVVIVKRAFCCRHFEEHSDEAIQSSCCSQTGLLRFARNDAGKSGFMPVLFLRATFQVRASGLRHPATLYAPW